MFCPKCGSQAADGQRFCANCGAEISSPGNSGGGQFNTPSQGGTPTGEIYQQTSYPMKWYKFLIYFSLIAGAVLNIIGGIMIIAGLHYELQGGEGAAELVYSFYGGGLKICDIIYGLACIAAGVFGIMVRMALAKYKADGPKMLYILCAINGVVPLVYSLIVSVIIGVSAVDSSIISSVMSAIVAFIINYTYFKKRAALFKN